MQETGLVTHTITRETAASSSAVITEKDAFVECLNAAKMDFGDISTITTDASPNIRRYMSTNEDSIHHGLDVWHLNKNLVKNLTKKATRKVCGIGVYWTP